MQLLFVKDIKDKVIVSVSFKDAVNC